MSPLHTIGNQIGEALELHRDIDKAEIQPTVVQMLDLVGFPDPAAAWSMYPMELSGGLRQRAMKNPSSPPSSASIEGSVRTQPSLVGVRPCGSSSQVTGAASNPS